jgi:mannosyl-oligosaccharide glucosidase
LQRTFRGNFSIDIFYDADDTPKGALLDGQGLTMALEASKEAYDRRFDQVLPVQNVHNESLVEYARDLTSQIVGGIGYYSGQSIVDRSFNFEYDEAMGEGALDASAGGRASDPQLTEEQQLLTATPSRSKFPRGFYWDEGFHLAHIGAWDNDLSLEILKSWIDLVDEDGWVAREQILGEEARSRVPTEFQTQYPLYANPPTLAMAITTFIDRLESKHGSIFPLEASLAHPDQAVFSKEGGSSSSDRYLEDPLLARSFLTGIYPKLRRHYLWLRRTQRGQITEWDRKARARGEGFRWRGRTKDHVLTSGLDDYPRATVPHVGELHLDLLSWMGAFAEAMTKIARAIGEEDDAEEYIKSHSGIIQNLDDLHWNEEEKMFCDASVDENEESFHVCHRGYISLFPFLLGLLPSDSPHLASILDIVRDPNHLWSDHGIRSLSKSHPLYGKGEDYWRGPIWIPLNYLALKALKTVSERGVDYFFWVEYQLTFFILVL